MMSLPNKSYTPYKSGRSGPRNIADWSPPTPIRGVYELPPAPVHALPNIVGNFVSEIAENVQVAVEAPFVTSLAVLSMLGAGRYRVRFENHCEAPPLWICALLDPGERKSTGFELISNPLGLWQKQETNRLLPHILRAEESFNLEEQRLSFLRGKASRSNGSKDREKNREEALELAQNRTPVPPSAELIIQDATPESVPKTLKQCRERVIVASDEGGFFATTGGRFSGIPNVDALNKSYDGSTIVVHRSNSDPIRLEHPHLSISLSVQPEILQKLKEQQHMRGTGFLARMIFVRPEGRVGTRLYRPEKISPIAHSEYENTIMAAMGEAPLFPPKDLQDISLSKEAHSIWVSNHDNTETEMSAGGSLESLRDWGSKLPGKVARIACAFHILRHATSDPTAHLICAQDMARAVEIAEFLKPHALATFGLIGMDSRHALAERLLRSIQKRGKTTIGRRDFNDSFRNEEKTLLADSIKLLVEHGFLREIPKEASKGPGQPPLQSYAVNPHIFNDAPCTINTKNTTYSPIADKEGPDDLSERTKLTL